MNPDKVLGVDRPRRSLLRVRNPERLRMLVITNSLQSWAGIERFTSLRNLTVVGNGSVDALTPLREVTSLRYVTMDVVKRPDDLDALSALALEWVTYSEASQDTPFSVDWLEPISTLERLVLLLPKPVFVSLGFLRAFSRLTSLTLGNVIATEGDKLYAEGFDSLQSLYLTVTDDLEVGRIRALLPGVDVEWQTTTVRPRILHGEDGLYQLYEDVAGAFGLETQSDALPALFIQLEERHPGMLGRITVDPEADGVGFYATDANDLQLVLDTLDERRHASKNDR